MKSVQSPKITVRPPKLFCKLQATENKSFNLGTEIEFRLTTRGCQRSGTHILPLNSGHAENVERSLLRNVGKHAPNYKASQPVIHAAVETISNSIQIV